MGDGAREGGVSWQMSKAPCAAPQPWAAGCWSFPARSWRRAGCVAGIMQHERDLVPDRAVGSVFVVVPTPILQLFPGICGMLELGHTRSPLWWVVRKREPEAV